jgi:hypothetical protein
MSSEHRFLRSFASACVTIFLFLVLLATWTDPFRNLNFPWATSFVSDRNVAFKRYRLMMEAPKITDVFIGSSTAEIFQPSVLRQQFPIDAFNFAMPAATLPLRYIMAKSSILRHPELKRVVMVSDLFEFQDFTLQSKIYHQPELRSYLEDEVLKQISAPSFSSRFQDYFSFRSVEKSFQTLADMIREKSGKKYSRFDPNGGTQKSMVVVNTKQPMEYRAQNAAANHRYLYGSMRGLNENGIALYRRLADFMRSRPQVELHIVLAPVHPLYFEYFEEAFVKRGLYQKWIQQFRDLERQSGGRVVIHDFSYPKYREKGISSDSKYWIDGVHFASLAMMQIAQEIYGRPAIAQKD